MKRTKCGIPCTANPHSWLAMFDDIAVTPASATAMAGSMAATAKMTYMDFVQNQFLYFSGT